MKEFECNIESDSKTVHADGITIELHRGRIYKENHPAVKAFPNLFKEKKSIIDIIEDAVEDLEEALENTLEEKPKTVAPKKNVSKGKNLDNKKKEVAPKPKNTKDNPSYIKLGLIGLAIVCIVLISGYLRVHGISDMFKISYWASGIVVGSFILSEFAIANIMLSEIKSKVHRAVNFIILGIIQLILIGIAFTFEFGALSNILVKQQNNITILDNKEQILKDNIKDCDFQISTIQKQIDLTSDKRVTEKKRLMSRLIRYTNKRAEANNELKAYYASDSNGSISDRTPLENTAKVFGVKEDSLMKGIVFALAGILNVLYLSFMYSFVSELKRKRSK